MKHALTVEAVIILMAVFEVITVKGVMTVVAVMIGKAVKQKNDMRRCDGLGLLGQPYSTG